MSGTTTDKLDFVSHGETFALTLTVSGSSGSGHVLAVSGTADGQQITGLNTVYETPDNVISTTYPYVDLEGISFNTAGSAYNLFYDNGALLLVSLSGGEHPATDATLTTCFLRGTLIETPRGERPVESLTVGTEVLTSRGAIKTVRWVATGRYMVPARRRNYSAPVIIRRGALADGVPSRDLHVTGGHSLLVDGVLIPAEFLVNHRSIVWDDRAQEIEIFHIELDDHDVLVADGAPAESYRDDGNRWMFRTAHGAWRQEPKPPIAPVLTGGSEVDAAWRALLRRSGERLDLPVTDDPDLHLLVDGRRVDGRWDRPGVFVAQIPPCAAQVCIASRAAAQDVLGLTRDPRVLGVALAHGVLWDGKEVSVIVADDPRLRDGFHAPENGAAFIWTNGRGVLPQTFVAASPRRRELHLYIAHTARYACSAAATHAAA